MGTRKRRGRLTARISQKRKAIFLEAYARLGNAVAAAEETGIDRSTHKFWLKSSAAYRAAFELAEDAATEALEREARRRALDGREDPVYFNGQQVGTVRKYSDLLLMFLLKAKRPEVYRERSDVRLQGQLQSSTTVKVIHEYHDGPPALNALPAVPALPPAEVLPDPDPES